MRTFTLNRNTDVSGVSGTGTVVEGVQFTDGTIAMRWLTATATTSLADCIEHVEAVHGHEGATTVIWDDESRVIPPAEVGKTVQTFTNDHFNAMIGTVISKSEVDNDPARWLVELPDGHQLWFRDSEVTVI